MAVLETIDENAFHEILDKGKKIVVLHITDNSFSIKLLNHLKEDRDLRNYLEKTGIDSFSVMSRGGCGGFPLNVVQGYFEGELVGDYRLGLECSIQPYVERWFVPKP